MEAVNNSRTEKLVFFIALAVIVSSLLLVWFVLGPERYYQGISDFQGYSLMADNMLKGNGFSSREAPPYLPTALRLPGYPLLIALSRFLVGNAGLLIVIQVLMFATIALFTFKIAKVLFKDERIAFVSALLMIFEIGNLSSFLTYMSDSISLGFASISLYYLYRFIKTSRMRDFLIDLPLVAFASFIRPQHLFTCVFYAAAFLWVFLWQRTVEFKKLPLYIFLFIFILLPFGGWAWRNYKTFGVFTLDTPPSILEFFQVAPTVKALGEGKTKDDILKELLLEFTDVHNLKPSETIVLEENPIYGDWAKNRAHEIFRQYPKEYRRVLLVSTFDFLTRAKWSDLFITYGLISSPNIQTRPLREILASGNLTLWGRTVYERFNCGKICLINFSLTALGRLFWIIMDLGAITGFVFYFKRTKDLDLRFFAMVLLGVILYVISSSVYYSGPTFWPRYRMTMAPFLFMFSVYGIWCIKNFLAGAMSKSKNPALKRIR